MEMWLSWKNRTESHQLPILPPSFEVEVENMNTEVNINELGNINLIGGSNLRRFAIESFFPNHDYSSVTTAQRHEPYTYVESIERWRKTKMPIRLVVTGTPINIAMAIERFTYGERDGSGDVYYILELAEYVFTGVKKKEENGLEGPSLDKDGYIKFDVDKTLKPELVTPVKGREVKDVGKSYTVKAGDTLSAIAKRATGNASNYKNLANKNGIKNPNRIQVGQVIKL